MSTPPRNVGSTVYPTITPSAAAITGWIPVLMSTPGVGGGGMTPPPRNVGSTVYPTITPSAAAITGWIPVLMSTPVCSHTAPDAQDLSTVPLHRRHSLPNPRQGGSHVGGG